MLASARRINWQCLSATSFKTDVGKTLDLLLDPPEVIANEVRDAVRRFRGTQAGTSSLLPGLIPTTPDVRASEPKHVDVLVPCFATTSRLTKISLAGPIKQLWQTKFTWDFVPAICGGQRTHARKAAVRDIEDSRCQLCLQATGTLAHRHVCPATAPPEGWPPIAPKASLVLGKVSEERKKNHPQRPFAAGAQGTFGSVEPTRTVQMAQAVGVR